MISMIVSVNSIINAIVHVMFIHLSSSFLPISTLHGPSIFAVKAKIYGVLYS